MAVRATAEWPVVVWDEGGSEEKAKEEGGAYLFLNLFVAEKNTNQLFLVSIKHRGHEERTKDNNHGRKAMEDGRMEGVGDDRVGEEGDAP